MPRRISSKSSFLFTSMVASAALAPILTSQVNFEDKDSKDSLSPKHISTSTSAHISLVNQGLFQLHQQKQSLSSEYKDHNSDQHLTATSHKKRESNVVNLVSIKEVTNLDHTALYLKAKENEIFETIESIWPDNTVLSFGDTGEKVETIQLHLSDIGYYVYDIDGKFGPKTFESIKLYQKKYGLKIDGIVGNETITHIVGTKHISANDLKEDHVNNSNVDSAKVYIPDDFAMRNVYINHDFMMDKVEESKSFFQLGDQHEEVSSLQEKLKETGYYRQAIDGLYGPGTEQAVRALQRDHSLLVDGIAGQEVTSFLASSNLQEIADKRKEILAAAAQQKINVKKVSESSTAVTSTTSRYSLPYIENIISSAKELIGTPYVWGGTTPNGFDCSGFLVYIYGKSEKSIPRTVVDIWNVSTPSSSLSRGDIVFFETYKRGPSHLGIYLGDGSFIHSGSSNGVTISDMNSTYWSQRYLGARSL